MRSNAFASVAVLLTVLVGAESDAGQVTLPPVKDNTLFEEPSGALSNGSGEHLFAGRSSLTTNNVRRAVLVFDIAGGVPAGATIESVALTLNMSMAPFGAVGQNFDLHRLLADWGEGASDATFQEGGGAPAAPDDATWLHTFFNTQFWSATGGDFSLTVSAGRSVGDVVGPYVWGPTQQMRDDVQAWLDDPSNNFGWMLRGNEAQLQSARRFDSRNNLNASVRPQLTVTFSSQGGPPAGRIDGTPLTLGRGAGGAIAMEWGASCLITDDDYAVYEGTLDGLFDSHAPNVCSTGGATSASVATMAGNSYFLVVPRNAAREGSYGTDSGGTPRTPSASACLPQETTACP